MDNRNVLVLLAVVFGLVVVWNILYFTGVVGNFGAPAAGIGTTPAPDQGLLPDVPRNNTRPQVSTRRGNGTAGAAPAAAREEVNAADIQITGNWGRNPFLTPREIWAIDNYVELPPPVYNPVPSGGLQLSAVLGDSDGRRTAVINDQPVTIGDVVAGMEIIDIWNDAVVFRVGTDTHVLRMNDAAVRLTVRGDGAGGQ